MLLDRYDDLGTLAAEELHVQVLDELWQRFLPGLLVVIVDRAELQIGWFFRSGPQRAEHRQAVVAVDRYAGQTGGVQPPTQILGAAGAAEVIVA